MNTNKDFPLFDERLPHLDRFIHELTAEYTEGNIQSWDDLEIKVKSFFTPDAMERTKAVIPHWDKMASYAGGVTLVHVMCVFTGLYRMPQFLNMTKEHQQLMKWVILFHDVEKEVQTGKRDHLHAFRSATHAARILPTLGFPVTAEYDSLIDSWDAYTRSSSKVMGDQPDHVQDNNRVPEIVEGIERMFGHNTSTALIVKTILFHLSIPATMWPPPNPLTQNEIKRYFDMDLMPLLKVMNLGDNDGWTLFDSATWELQRADTVNTFEQLERLLLE